MAKVRPGGEKSLVEVPARAAPGEIDEPVENEQPGEKEVPAPPGSEIEIAGKRDPTRKSALRDLTIFGGETKHARGVKGMSQDRRFSDEAILRLAGRDREGGVVEIGRVADIERGMRVEDLQSAQQKK